MNDNSDTVKLIINQEDGKKGEEDRDDEVYILKPSQVTASEDSYQKIKKLQTEKTEICTIKNLKLQSEIKIKEMDKSWHRQLQQLQYKIKKSLYDFFIYYYQEMGEVEVGEVEKLQSEMKEAELQYEILKKIFFKKIHLLNPQVTPKEFSEEDLKTLKKITGPSYDIEPYYNIPRREQIIGRPIHQCKHKDLQIIVGSATPPTFSFTLPHSLSNLQDAFFQSSLYVPLPSTYSIPSLDLFHYNMLIDNLYNKAKRMEKEIEKNNSDEEN